MPWQPQHRVPAILTSPWPEEFQPPEDPNLFLPSVIQEDNLRLHKGEKLIEYMARGSDTNVISYSIIPRLSQKPSSTDATVLKRHALSQASQRGREARGMLTKAVGRSRRPKFSTSTAVPMQTQTVLHRLSALQMLYVSINPIHSGH
jgi:hypothetical protein